MMANSKYYITFGVSEEYPFRGGWVEVEAKSESEARDKATKRYGLTDQGFARFCSSYDENYFKQTKMFKDGNWGEFCWESF